MTFTLEELTSPSTPGQWFQLIFILLLFYCVVLPIVQIIIAWAMLSLSHPVRSSLKWFQKQKQLKQINPVEPVDRIPAPGILHDDDIGALNNA